MSKFKKEVKDKKKRRFSFKIFIAFIAFEVVFTAITGPLYLYYGPFVNVKKGFVGAAMTSYKSQFLAKWFLSQSEIDKILAENNNIEEGNTDASDKEISIPKSHDDTIERFDIESDKFKGYLLVVKDPTRVHVGYTSKLGKEGQTVSQIAKDNNAVAAINAGGFTDKSANSTWAGNGGQVLGLIMTGGKVISYDSDENSKTDMIALTKEGRLLVGKYSLKELNNLGAQEAVTFGPALVINGKGTIKSGDGGWGIAPRTVIGQRSDASIMLLVIDGRQVFKSVGATLKEAQDVMIKYGAVNAANLDGGKSTTMYYEGDVINTPSDSLGERSIPTAFIVK
jgi:Exopolysaccharide biosynthesis protein related to N-acetylglucosamine-1-phosphodiester alpha-N-acetylglucosaminidase